MTPHASHAMGTVAGEPCCTVCYAAAWMPLVEHRCGYVHMERVQGDDAASVRDMTPLTDTTRARVLRLYETSRTTGQIATECGVSKSAVCRIARAAGLSRTTGRPRGGTVVRREEQAHG